MELDSTAIVVRRVSNVYWARFDQRELACTLRGRLKKEDVDVRVGDRVVVGEVDEANAAALITAVLPRRNAMSRPPIANLDQVVVVFAASDPPFDPIALDRFLALAAMSDLPCAIVVNKCELVSRKALDELLDMYRVLGFPVAVTSARDRQVTELAGLLRSRVSVFAGPSGVGKSSLLNVFDPTLSLKEAEVSPKLGRGRHTTTTASLHPIAGGLVADTPGYSRLTFPTWSPADLGWLWPEMRPWIPNCPLSKCLHDNEPDCAVKRHAQIGETRYLSYLRFLAEIKAADLKARSCSNKAEGATKTSGGGVFAKRLIRLGTQEKEDSRKVTRQRLAELAMQAPQDRIDEETWDDLDVF